MSREGGCQTNLGKNTLLRIICRAQMLLLTCRLALFAALIIWTQK